MTKTDDIKARLQDMAKFLGQTFVVNPDKLARFRRWEAQHITRLEERCAALEGQVVAGAAEIERLKKEADGKFVQAAVNVMQRYPGFEWRDYTPDGISAEDFEEFFTEDLNEAWRVSEREKARAESAEREAAALKEEVGRLREALQWVDDMRMNGCPMDISNRARAALQPQEPKP